MEELQIEAPQMELLQKEIVLEYATLRYEEPIIHITFKENIELGFPETRELIFNSEKLSNNKPYFVLSDVRTNVQVTPEGKRVAANANEAILNRGCAILLNSNMLKLGINFFNEFNTPSFPFRAFTDKQEAIDWLLKLPLTSLPQNL